MMFRLSKSTLSWAGVAVAAILFTLAVPRAAHAVAAALVQVTNTASSPVISQDIGNQAAQIVQIECGVVPGSGITDPGHENLFGCVGVPALGVGSVPQSSVYTVPAGETLVVTSVDILSGALAGTPCMSPAFPQLFTSTPNDVLSARKSWIVPGGAGTAHYVYPSGILIPGGETILGIVNFATVSNCTITIDMHGYLTAQ
jgi:hypothetical protein